jgi:peptidoglycan-associated lipoprotein
MKKLSFPLIALVLVTAISFMGCARCKDCPKVVKTIILEGVNFDFDKSTLRPDAKNILDDDIRLLKSNSRYRVSIEGHCDVRGSDAYNMELGQRRADSVYNYLLKQGIPADRMDTVSYGRSKPLLPNTTEANMAKNRRVEMKIIQVR